MPRAKDFLKYFFFSFFSPLLLLHWKKLQNTVNKTQNSFCRFPFLVVLRVLCVLKIYKGMFSSRNFLCNLFITMHRLSVSDNGKCIHHDVSRIFQQNKKISCCLEVWNLAFISMDSTFIGSDASSRYMWCSVLEKYNTSSHERTQHWYYISKYLLHYIFLW